MATQKEIEFAQRINVLPGQPLVCSTHPDDPSNATSGLFLEVNYWLSNVKHASTLAEVIGKLTDIPFEVAMRMRGTSMRQVIFCYPTIDEVARLEDIERKIIDNLGTINEAIDDMVRMREANKAQHSLSAQAQTSSNHTHHANKVQTSRSYPALKELKKSKKQRIDLSRVREYYREQGFRERQERHRDMQPVPGQER